jgi:acetyl-CoA acyltransferase
MCLLMEAEAAARRGLAPLARIHTIAAGACAPTDLIYSAVPATRRALARANLRLDDMATIEINEAFGLRAAGAMRELDFHDASRGT